MLKLFIRVGLIVHSSRTLRCLLIFASRLPQPHPHILPQQQPARTTTLWLALHFMNQIHLFKTTKVPIVVAYDMGVDSTSVIIGILRRNIRPDLILFADTGGEKVIKVIGYDAGPADLRRRNHVGDATDKQYQYYYPLIDWGWDREECKRQIAKAGLPVPPKSACFFCPATKPYEIDQYPQDLLRRVVRMEVRAQPRLTTTEGLWRKSTKARPGLITDYIVSKNLLPKDEIEHLKETVTKEILSFQKGYAEALEKGMVRDFLKSHQEFDYRGFVRHTIHHSCPATLFPAKPYHRM
ncbi:MAG: hypothetical protein ACO1QB_07430 [Verrucomicrobiales bacterium]